MAPKPKKTTAQRSKTQKSKIPPGVPLDAVDLVAYAEESIVSRTLAENAAGTVTAFAFDAGQGLSEHTAPFDALVHVIDGEGKFVVDGKARRVAAGELFLMPAGIPHAVKAIKRFKMLLILLRAKN